MTRPIAFAVLWLLANAGVAFAQSAATRSTPVGLNAADFGAICDGGSHLLSSKYGSLGAAQTRYPFVTSLSQQIDYAALKLMSNTALGADGAEHGSSGPVSNKPMFVPAGTCNLGSDVWTIRAASGMKLEGAGKTATQITGSGAATLQFDGLWYSSIRDMSIVNTGATSGGEALDVDGNVPGHPYGTFTVQGNNFTNLLLMANGGATYTVAMCRQGGNGAQCSENTFVNMHLQGHGTVSAYYQRGFNAIDNVVVGGDIQDFPKYGVYLVAGNIHIVGTSFESTFGYTQVTNGGCDIDASSGGSFNAVTVVGSRTEDFCVYNGAFSQLANLSGISQNIAVLGTWAQSTAYSLGDMVTFTTGSVACAYRVTTAGTSGSGSRPGCSTTTETDGTITWTKTPYTAISIAAGWFDTASSSIDPTATIVSQSAVFSAGSGDFQHSTSNGLVVDGSNAGSETCALAQGATVCLYANLGGAGALKSGLTLPASSAGLVADSTYGLVIGPVSSAPTFVTGALNTHTTFASLGSGGFVCNSGFKGNEVYVTDATNPGGGNTIVAGSGSGVKGICNGTNWVSQGPSTGFLTTSDVSSTSGNIVTESGTSGTAVHDGGIASSDISRLGTAQTVTGAKTFGQVQGGARTASGATDTLLGTDCGKEILYTNAGAVTVTIPASIVPAVGTLCNIRVRATTANKVSVNGTAVTAATLVSADSFTGTQAVAGSAISLDLTTVGSTTTAFLDGHGS